MNRDEIINFLTDYCNKDESIQCAILFGSFAAHRETKDSDIDLAIFSQAEVTADQKMKMIDDVTLATNRPLDLIDLKKTHVPLLQEILTKGIYIKLSSIDLKEYLIKKMQLEVADFLPIKKRTQLEKIKRFLTNG